MKGTTPGSDRLVLALGTELATAFAGADSHDLAATRVREIEGMLARALILEQPACVIQVPRLSKRASRELSAFATKHLPARFGFAICSRSGGRLVRLPGDRRMQSQADAARRSAAATSGQLPPMSGEGFRFSDAVAWLVKILLLQDAAPAHWAGPRGPFHSIAELAEASGVAYSAVHRVVAGLRSRRWISEGASGLRIIAVRDLIETWFAAQVLAPRAAVPVRGLFGSLRQRIDRHEKLGRALTAASGSDAPRWAFSAWSAAAALGLGHVVGAKRMSIVFEADFDQAVERWSLQRVEPGEATFWISPTASTRSVFSGSVRVGRGMCAVDALQAALEVSTDANRGREQAWHILAAIVPGMETDAESR